jgi:hypothetical protein
LPEVNGGFESLTESAEVGNLFGAEFAHASIMGLTVTGSQQF